MYNESIENKYYEKKTLVTINSNDRIKTNKIITTKNPTKVLDNGLKILDYETILVEHPNHNFELINSNEIIFKNITGTFNANLNKYTLGGIPVDFLNYDSNSGKPIFNVDLVYTYENNIKVSNSYKIKIPVNIDRKFIILNSIGGGSNISVELIENFINGYEDSSYYKIVLPRRFTNIKNVRLVSLEMSNAQYAIRDTISKKYNNKEDYINHNNFLHWINADDLTKIKNNFLINNEKLLTIINNDTTNIPITWTKNNTTEEILYEYLSDMYLNKINTNFKNIQQNFINLLYFIKNKIETNTILTSSNLNIINHNDSYLVKFNINNNIYQLHLNNRIYTFDLDFSIQNQIKTIDRNVRYIFYFKNKNTIFDLKSINIISDTSTNNDYISDSIIIQDNQLIISIPLNEIIINNTLYIIYILNNNNSVILYTLNINNTNIIRYYIDDFYDKDILIDFVYKFTNYNFTINSYNTNLNTNFDETYTYNEPSSITAPVNIFNYLRNISEYKNQYDITNKLYFNFISNTNINLTYDYIKYLFISNISILINELSQYSYSNINKNKLLESYQQDFINYLINLYNNIKKPLTELQQSIISYGYLVSFYYNSYVYRLYFYNKPVDNDNIVNYNINDLKILSIFTTFIKNFTTVNNNYNLYNINYNITNSNIISKPITSIFENNTYILPDTRIILTDNSNLTIDIYRNITYTFDISQITKNIKVSTSNTIALDYNFNNNISNNQDTIVINISNYENINNLYILLLDNNENITETSIITLKIKTTSIYKTDFSIYGYLHNLSLLNKIEYIYNNNIVNYTYINNSFVTEIKKIIIEINKNESSSYNLLTTSKPNINNQFYWILPTILNTNIYTSSIIKNLKIDTMIENKYNYTDIMNIKYIQNNVDIYNIYPINSIQINKGNYIIDDFVNELEAKLNSLSKKKYSYKEKIFIENTTYNIKTSLKHMKDKSIFKVDLNESNNLVNIYQYKILYSYSLLDIKTNNQTGPFIVNEGYPYIYVKFKNHTLKTGDVINIIGSSSIFNLPMDIINKKHIVYTNKIYRGYIRFILPLDNTSNPNNIDNNYYYEGNDFIQYSNYKFGLNKINRIDSDIKNTIGNNNKDILLDYDISIYELFTDINNLNIEIKDNTKLGRVLNITKDITTNNYIIDYNLLSNSNFVVGNIIKTGTTNTYAMFVPENWNNNYLPKTYDIIDNNIEIINNITEGFSIKLDKNPNQSSLEGTGGIDVNILQATSYSLLFDKDNTLNDVLGFEKKMTDFSLVHSNTYKSDTNIIDYSYVEPSYFSDTKNNDKYIMLKTLINHNYTIGSYIYINNHYLNYRLINSYKKTKLNIKEYLPFIAWYNDLPIQEQINIKNSFSPDSQIFDNYCEKGLIIYYTYPYTNLQIQDLGNLGMPVNSYDNIDYFSYKETPIPNIYNLKPNTYIFINENQKTINKSIAGVNTVYKIGLRDGYYKVLNNIPIYNNSYYKNFFNNTNCALIECNYISITEDYSLNTINYNESVISNTNIKESVLEGYLNDGEIVTSSLDTNIVGHNSNNSNNLNKYTSILLNQVNNTKINVFFPIQCTNYYYLNNNNNVYYLNNLIINTLDIYENINYTFDISNISLLNKNFILSINNTNILPFVSDNNNIININGLPGTTDSSITINIVNNVNKLYLYIDYILILTLNIIEINNINYNVSFLNNNTIEFINTDTNTILINPTLHIEFGYKYRFYFSTLNMYNNFILINEFIYNTKITPNYITYNETNLYIEIFLIDNNYDDEIYYQLNNTEQSLGKLILGIYKYYTINEMVLYNSVHIDNINNIYLSNENINKNVDTNIINYIENINKYYFTLIFKNTINILDDKSHIIPHVNINFLEENCIQNTNIIKIKKTYDILYVKEIKQNEVILTVPNYNLHINKLIILKNNIPNTILKINTYFYIIEIDNTYTKIKLGNLNDKLLVIISDIRNFSSNIMFHMFTSYNYKHKNELINKSIKINYLESYNNLTNATYNTEISKLNNRINYINVSNNIYYNNISSNIKIIENNLLENLNWTTPHGTIYIDLSENSIVNYIKFNNINNNNNNHPYKIYLYYIESDITHYIGSLTDVINNSILLNINNKKKFIIYIESYGLYNNIYSELTISNIELGYINPIKNDIAYLDKYITRLAINNIVNKYTISDNYLDSNTINDTNVLLLNNSKSSIIDITFNTPTSLKYYNIIQNITDNNITINNNNYITNFNGTITSIQLFGSNNIDYSNEIEITNAKYINTNIIQTLVNNNTSSDTLIVNTQKYINHTLTFSNELSFTYYRFKILSNINYYPYLKPVTNITEYIQNDTIQLSSIPTDYLFNYNNNSININNNTFNLNISGIIVGNYEMVNYSNLYIEDINYITDAIITNTYIELYLKYNLLNSHLAGENVVISSSKTSENLFSTQSLIIYDKWYTRIFYEGYNSLYNNNHISKTYYETINDYNLISDIESNKYQIYSNSKYIFKYTTKIRIYELIENVDNSIQSITEINYNTYNINTPIDNIYETYVYTTISTNNINYKYINLNSNNHNFKLILLPIDDYDKIIDGINKNTADLKLDNNNSRNYSYRNINLNKNNNKEGLPIIQDYLTNNIHIEQMNGFYIAENNYKLVNNILQKSSDNNIITPVQSLNYDTYTYTYLDLIHKSDNLALHIDENNLYNNGIPIYGVFSDNNYIDNYTNDNYYVNYYSVTIEGKYLGYGGKINNKNENNDNLLNNSLEGFKILDIGYDSNNNKNIIKLDLKLSQLSINTPEIYLGDINNINDITKKNKYTIGYGGNLYQKKIFKNIDAISGPKYLYLSINKLNSILTTNKTSYFSKIMLKSTPGNHLYENEFITNETIFDKQPLDELSELEIKFINDEGKLFDLEKTEHSMVLEITEYVKNYDNSNYLL